MTLEVSKHSKNVQSRTEIKYVDTVADPWIMGLNVPDAALALFLTWHKAGYAMPQELIENSRRKLDLRRARMEGPLGNDPERAWEGSLER